MNLHSIVRGSIGSINKDREWSIFLSRGYEVDENGNRVQIYESPKPIFVQVQQTSADEVSEKNGASVLTTSRKLWLFSSSSPSRRPWSLFRPLARSGDYVADENGDFWKITSVEEDFSNEGWVSVIATLTEKIPSALMSFANDRCE